MKKSAAIILAMLIVSGLALAQDKLMTAKDFTSLKAVSSPSISPDGSRIIYSLRQADLEKSSYKSKVMIYDVESAKYWQFLGEEGGRNFQWNPDANKIAFLRRGQIWTIPASFGEASQLTDIKTRVRSYRWMPCGKKIIIMSREPRANEKEYKARMKRRDDGYVVDAELFRDQFYIFDLASGKAEKINDGHPGISSFSLSPDGTRVVYSTNYTGKMDDDLKFDLWLVNLKDGSSYKIADLHGPETNPEWSPDGKTIAYLSTTEGDVEYAQSDITFISPEKDSKPKVMTADFDRSIGGMHWLKNGYIYATVSDKTETPLYRMDPKTGKMEKFNTNGYNVRSVNFSRDNRFMVTTMEKYPELSDLFLFDMEKWLAEAYYQYECPAQGL
jgi:dipeptidyl aminopeptidase/acylaminoacyl peptidase